MVVRCRQLPEPDALEKLLDLYAGWPAARQEKTAFLGCLCADIQDGVPRHGCIVTDDGIQQVDRRRNRDTTSAMSLSGRAVCIGWTRCARSASRTSYVLDWGEVEYGYRVMQAGYGGYIHQDALLHHNIGGRTYKLLEFKLGPLRFKIFEAPPIRCYYGCRNMLYFLLHEIRLRRPKAIVPPLLGVARQTAGYLLKPKGHREHILACFRGFWHGVTGNIGARY